jgi:hypothetical protein
MAGEFRKVNGTPSRGQSAEAAIILECRPRDTLFFFLVLPTQPLTRGITDCQGVLDVFLFHFGTDTRLENAHPAQTADQDASVTIGILVKAPVAGSK